MKRPVRQGHLMPSSTKKTFGGGRFKPLHGDRGLEAVLQPRLQSPYAGSVNLPAEARCPSLDTVVLKRDDPIMAKERQYLVLSVFPPVVELLVFPSYGIENLLPVTEKAP